MESGVDYYHEDCWLDPLLPIGGESSFAQSQDLEVGRGSISSTLGPQRDGSWGRRRERHERNLAFPLPHPAPVAPAPTPAAAPTSAPAPARGRDQDLAMADDVGDPLGIYTVDDSQTVQVPGTICR